MTIFKKYSIPFLVGVFIGTLICFIIMSIISMGYYKELNRVLNNNIPSESYEYKGPIKNI